MKALIKAFFFSKGKFCPPYFWMNIFLLMALAMTILRAMEIGNFSDTLILGILGFVQVWAGLFNWHNIRAMNVAAPQDPDAVPPGVTP